MIGQRLAYALISGAIGTIVCTASVCAEGEVTEKPGTNAGTTAPSPELIIVRPREGETFDDTPLVLQVEVRNFELRPPEPVFGEANPAPLGHLHVFLDDYPEVATSSTQLMFGKKDAKGYLRKGQHEITVELVHDNHDVLEPRVWKRVHFTITH